MSGVSVLDFFFINAAINGVAMAIYIPVILFLNLRFLPKSDRPGVINVSRDKETRQAQALSAQE